MKILLPVDGSSYTARTLDYLATHGKSLGGPHAYTVFTVVPSVPPHAARFLSRGTLEAYYREQAALVLEPVCKFAERQGWQFEARHDHGHAAQGIAEQVLASPPDLIVMGTQGHTALASLILGSVTQGVLARCQVPVLLIR